jgi:c-di-GMP-binding flagellar brake protein YcgR
MDHPAKTKGLSIGIGTELFISIHGIDVRLRSSLVGIKPDEYLIIDMPRISDIESKTFAGNKLVVTYMLSGAMYSFKAEILNSIRKPCRLIFISHPEDSARQELRNHQRVECYIPAVAKLYGDEVEYGVMILDISLGGCKFSSEAIPKDRCHLFQPQAKINLNLALLSLEDMETIKGEIMNTKQDASRVFIGVKFEDISNRIRSKLDAYVKSVMEHLL